MAGTRTVSNLSQRWAFCSPRGENYLEIQGDYVICPEIDAFPDVVK